MDNMTPLNKVITSEFGTYTISPTSFAYRWDHRSQFSKATSNIQASHDKSFNDRRRFELARDSNRIHFVCLTPPAEFRFSADRLDYLEDGKLLRAWKRITRNDAS